MLKAKDKAGNILLGIDADNVKALKAGNPIHISGCELNIPHDILIIYGETLRDVANEIGVGDTFEEPEKPIPN